MARTANRYLSYKSEGGSQVFRVAHYIRLSVDSDYTGSDSISHQRKLGQEYMENHSDMVFYAEYIDDGHTGTNFKRPAFDRMIADMKLGIISCIIVKDLSRFGREYLESGNYIEKVFPFLGIRFVSIVDNYDSIAPDCDRELLKISLKNLAHEMYAKDISKKVGSTYQMKQDKEIFYRTSNIPYGYKMNQEKDNYIPDEKTAPIVKTIFALYENGMSKYGICQWLNKQNIHAPGAYQKTGHVYREACDEPSSWILSTMGKLLNNEVYMGVAVRHKTESRLSENIKNEKVLEQDWVRIKNNHEPLILEETFFHVVEQMKVVGNTYSQYRANSDCVKTETIFVDNIFANILVCGDCKGKMIRVGAYHSVNGEKVRHKIFKCNTHRTRMDMCDSKFIEEKVLCDIIFETVKKQILLMSNVKKMIESNSRYSFELKCMEIQGNLSKIENAITLLMNQYMATYSNYCDNEISTDMFEQYRKQFNLEKSRLEQEKKLLEMEEKKVQKAQKAFQKLVKSWLQNGKSKQLTANMVASFVDHIEVYQNKRIEITLKYGDCFREVEKYLKKGV